MKAGTKFLTSSFRFTLPFAVFCLLLSACYQPVSACLDINAVNFDATADKSCCCTYPKLNVTIYQNFNKDTSTTDIPYKDNQNYQNDNGWFRINNIVFYLSDLELTQSNTIYKPADSLKFKVIAPNLTDTLSQSFINDFMLVRRSDSGAKNAGTFRQNGYFDGMQFRVGLTDAANKILQNKTASTHPLHDSLWINKTIARFIVAKDTITGTVPDTLTFSASDPLFAPILVTPAIKNSVLFHPTGFDFDIVLAIDYNKLFKGVNWSVHDPAAWKLKIHDNFPNAFRVSQ
jgi:hypothetical protein